MAKDKLGKENRKQGEKGYRLMGSVNYLHI
jgi:hypothetical protein